MTKNAPTPDPTPAIVALGASSGGLVALREFLTATPTDTGFAFVVVTHQAPDDSGTLPQRLQSHCELPVVSVHARREVEPDHVYVAAPGCVLALSNGHLVPMSVGTNHPIDYFFSSLADDRRDLSVAVVLSGSGTDGTLGVQAIRAAGGLTIAQEEDSAQYSGMPHGAIASKAVDFVVTPSAMPRLIIEHFSAPYHVTATASDDVERILLLLRRRVGHNFSGYKRPTIRRCIGRRLAKYGIESVSAYVELVEANPSELDELLQEVLIGVTSFFRDAEAFESLRERVIAPLLARHDDGSTIRVWVAGCSTGEEAYSIAILLREELDKRERAPKVRVFATDLNPVAIGVARAGLYPASIVEALGESRARKYFRRDHEQLRIRRVIREMIVFSIHDMLEDPPFAKVALLCCRNVLIYLGQNLQKHLVPILAYAIAPGGTLFLGSAESPSAAPDLFDSVDPHWRIFSPKPSSPNRTPHRALPARMFSARTRPTEPTNAERALLDHLAPPAVLVDERGELLHVHGHTGAFLELARGPRGHGNIVAMARHDLPPLLAAGLRQAVENKPVLYRDVSLGDANAQSLVDVRIQRITRPDSLRGSFIISFESERPIHDSATRDLRIVEDDDDVGRLAEALEQSRLVQRDLVEDAQSVGAELSSAHDRFLATNEALQGANEELETSKEEMQSLNEELQTVNAELQSKVEELSEINDDMKNVLNGTDIAAVFLDRTLRIKRFTEKATNVFRLIPSDVGRPLEDIVHRLHYNRILDDVQDVLSTLSTREEEVQTAEGGWLLVRILPYRTVDNVVDGVAIAFVDITAVKEAQKSERRIVDTLAGSPTTFFGQNLNLVYEWATADVLGAPLERVLGHHDKDLFLPDVALRLSTLKQRVLDTRGALRSEIALEPNGPDDRYDMFVSPRFGVDGEVDGLRGIITTIPSAEGR